MQAELAHFQHIAIVGHGQRGAGVLLDQHDGHAGLAQLGDDGKNLAHHQRSQAQAGFIQHQQAGARHQRTAHRQHLPLAARKRSGQLQPPLFQARKQVIHIGQPVAPLGVAQPHLTKAAEHQVVFYRHAAEQFTLFWHQRNAEHDAVFQAQRTDGFAIERNAALSGQDAHQRIEQR